MQFNDIYRDSCEYDVMCVRKKKKNNKIVLILFLSVFKRLRARIAI